MESILASRASKVVVTGILFNGISAIVVTPPEIAAFVADSNPSHSTNQ